MGKREMQGMENVRKGFGKCMFQPLQMYRIFLAFTIPCIFSVREQWFDHVTTTMVEPTNGIVVNLFIFFAVEETTKVITSKYRGTAVVEQWYSGIWKIS